MEENVKEGLFTVKSEGTFVQYASMDKDILDKLKVGSSSRRVLNNK